MSQRTERVDELLRQEIGEILARGVKDPRVGFATVTEVETSPDLRHARVWVSVIGSDPERAATLAALEGAMGFVRRELGGRLRLRRIPELHVALDDSAERGTRVLHLARDDPADLLLEQLVDASLALGHGAPFALRTCGRGDQALAARDTVCWVKHSMTSPSCRS